jgi:hypothetical protein
MRTRPVKKMDHDEQELHEYIRRLTEKPKDVAIEGDDEEEEDEEEPVTDDRVTIIPEPVKE